MAQMDNDELVWQLAGLFNEAEGEITPAEVRKAALGYIAGRQWDDDPADPLSLSA
jgi:hypothetical protein